MNYELRRTGNSDLSNGTMSASTERTKENSKSNIAIGRLGDIRNMITRNTS
jgi:hypothetical protein